MVKKCRYIFCIGTAQDLFHKAPTRMDFTGKKGTPQNIKKTLFFKSFYLIPKTENQYLKMKFTRKDLLDEYGGLDLHLGGQGGPVKVLSSTGPGSCPVFWPMAAEMRSRAGRLR